jgi:hypothetical protein
MLNYHTIKQLKIEDVLGREVKFISPRKKCERIGVVTQVSKTHCWTKRNAYGGDEYVPWGNVVEILPAGSE